MSDPRRIVPTLGTSVPRLLDQISALRYVTAENAPNYRAIVQVFSEARERYEIELRPSDVRERLARSGLHHDLPADADLDRHLDQLVAWGKLQRSHDTANVARVADFYLRRFTYRLTPVGEAAQRDRKSTRLNSSHVEISYAVFCLKKKKKKQKYKKIGKKKKQRKTEK